MKISLSDRYEALKRNSKYCKEWEKWQRSSGRASDGEFRIITKNLKSKYHVPKLPTPLKYSSYSRLQVKPKLIEVIPFIDPKERGPAPLGSKGRRRTMTQDMKALREKRTVTVDDFFEERRYLHLKVDITGPLDKLESAFKDKTREWKNKWKEHYKEDGGTKERFGKTEEDPWEVYDSITYQGKDLTSLAQAKEGINELPSQNDFVGARYKKLSRAYKKAVKMIKEVIQ